jgi:lysophospholipase L1-like esterase
MKQFAKNGSPFFVMVLTLIFLLVLSRIPDGYQIKVLGWEYKVKKLDMFQDVTPDTAQQQNSSDHARLTSRGTELFAASIFSVIAENGPSEKMMPEPAAPAPKIENAGHLKSFFQATKSASGKKVRIAHYGDSGIEGDNITADIRQKLQSKLGGNGVGIVGVNPLDVQFRTTTKIQFSSDWKTASVLNANPEKLPLGVNGYVYQPSANSWVSYETTGRYNVKNFSAVRILYASEKNVTVKYSFDNGGETSVELKASKQPVDYLITAKNKVRSVKITVVNPSKTYFYGVSLEDGNGVFVDNFPLRGNSGAALRDLDVATLKSLNKVLDYKLIILNFGLNIAGEKDYGWYESSMERVISQLKDAFPGSAVLVVSVHDKDVKKGTQFVTEPGVPKLVEAQRHIAQKAGVAFLNLYEAMGGANSMNDWVNQGLAEKDYTHMKLPGAKKIADLITDALLEAGK